MALGNLVKGFIDKLMSGDKPAGEIIKETIGAVINDQQRTDANNAQAHADPIEQQISQDGYVWQSRLWRRHVMAQMFRMLHRKRRLAISEQNYDDLLAKRGTNYTWRMLRNELYAQSQLAHSDPQQLAERNRWFNCALVEAMARDLAAQGVSAAQRVLANLVTVNDPAALFEAVKPMKDVDVPGKMKSQAWLDAYKGAGAYFTMKNLILFHNCMVHLDNGQVLDRDASFSYIQQLNANPAVGGQQMFAVMLRLIADNNFDWQG